MTLHPLSRGGQPAGQDVLTSPAKPDDEAAATVAPVMPVEGAPSAPAAAATSATAGKTGNAAAAIAAERVSFTYDGDTFVLQDIDLTVARGEFLAVLGGNGSGKSTLAKHMNALLTPDAGSMIVLGCNTSDQTLTYTVRSRAGMVFQNPDDQLVASLVENDVAFGPENLGIPAPELRTRVDESLKAVGLEGFQKRETGELSGGQKQRVAVAGVLAMRPDIVILDEATSMLDPQGRLGLLELCQQLHRQGKTIIMITHFMEEAALADRVVVLNAGRIACEGTPDEVLSQAELLEHLNLDVPFACALSLALRRAGVDAGVHIRPESLKEELCRLHSKA